MPPKEGLKLVTFSFAFKPELPELPFGALNWSNSSWSSSHSPSRQPSVWLAATHADKTLRMAARPSHISVSSLIWKHLKWILSQNANHIFANSSLSCSFLAKKVPAFRNEPMHRHRIIGTAFVSFQQNPYNVCVCVCKFGREKSLWNCTLVATKTENTADLHLPEHISKHRWLNLRLCLMSQIPWPLHPFVERVKPITPVTPKRWHHTPLHFPSIPVVWVASGGCSRCSRCASATARTAWHHYLRAMQ